MSRRNKTILVTGGAGFIGSHICRQELNQGHHVICLDNLYSSSGRNIAQMQREYNFRHINNDVQYLDDVHFPQKIDLIYHLACPASPVWYQKDPVKTLMTSVVGTKKILDLATQHQARVLFTSTSEVYGDPDVHPQIESYNGNVNISGERSCYDEGKRAAETLCHDFKRKYNTDVIVTRLFNTYGPNMAANDGRVVSNFITQAIEGKPLTIYGSGLQTRSFCYVDDMVHLLRALMWYDGPVTTPINVGNPEEYRICDIAEVVVRSVPGCASHVSYQELPQDDPRVRRPDITKLRQQLTVPDFTSLQRGLARTVEYFTKELDLC